MPSDGRETQDRIHETAAPPAEAAASSGGKRGRFHGGIHFMFEIEDSHEVCKQIADYLYRKHMQRKF